MNYGFPYRTIEELYAVVRELPRPGDVEILNRPVKGLNFRLRNALAVQPMEGCDAENGAPGELTYRRYERFARGGAGLIWVEAIAVSEESMANPGQLRIDEGNLFLFRALIGRIRAAALAEFGDEPLIIAQLTHSGRYSKPGSAPAPIRAWRSEALDGRQGIPEDAPVIPDEALNELPEKFARATALCREAGFDGVDVKACHLYLLSELLGARGRPGRYGGSFENRTRALLGCVDAARGSIAGGVLASRINLYDGAAGNFGAGESGIDFSEPLMLVRELEERGVTLLNLTMGTPYVNPHVNRPYARGGYEPPEPPVCGVARLLRGCAVAQAEAKHAVCVATGFSYLRHFAPPVAAGLIAAGGAKAVGFGRGAFAYPEFARDIAQKGTMNPQKCCVACGLCTAIMRAGGSAGCPVRDAAVYAKELYRVTGKGKNP